jgi:hypothetical protein
MNTEVHQGRVNWHQALAEVALIGMGVLAALAVDSWWDERKERKAEIEYLWSLQADFETNRQELLKSIANEEEIIALGKTLHSHIGSEFKGVSSAELNKLIGSFYWLFEWGPVTGTYDEMLGSGRLLYLRNKTLRVKLSQYVSSLESIKVTERMENTSWFSEQLPFLRLHLNESSFGWIGDYHPNVPYDEDFRALQSREFHNLVSSWMVSHDDVIKNYRRAIDDGDEILQIIESELRSE